MDWDADAQRDLLDRRRDVRDAEAKLATLTAGSPDHLLLAEAVSRLGGLISLAARNQARRAALFDAAALAATAKDEYESTYAGASRPDYLPMLAACLTTVGGRLEEESGSARAAFDGHCVTIRFGSTKSHDSDRPLRVPAGRERRAAETHTEDEAAERRRKLKVRYRAAYIEGAEARSRADCGHGLTDQELEGVLARYLGDVEDP